MQLLFIFCESGVEEKLMAMLIEIGVPGYSRFTNSTGYGKNGRREGSPIWPGLNTLLMVGVPREMTPKVLDAVNKLEEQRNQQIGGAEKGASGGENLRGACRRVLLISRIAQQNHNGNLMDQNRTIHSL